MVNRRRSRSLRRRSPRRRSPHRHSPHRRSFRRRRSRQLGGSGVEDLPDEVVGEIFNVVKAIVAGIIIAGFANMLLPYNIAYDDSDLDSDSDSEVATEPRERWPILPGKHDNDYGRRFK